MDARPVARPLAAALSGEAEPDMRSAEPPRAEVAAAHAGMQVDGSSRCASDNEQGCAAMDVVSQLRDRVLLKRPAGKAASKAAAKPKAAPKSKAAARPRPKAAVKPKAKPRPAAPARKKWQKTPPLRCGSNSRAAAQVAAGPRTARPPVGGSGATSCAAAGRAGASGDTSLPAAGGRAWLYIYIYRARLIGSLCIARAAILRARVYASPAAHRWGRLSRRAVRAQLQDT